MSAAITAAVVGGGLSYLGSRKSAKAASKDAPEPIDIFARPYITVGGERVYDNSLAQKQAEGMLAYYKQNIPGFLALQKKFGPNLMKQSLRESQQYLTGIGGQMGLFGLTELAGKEAQKQIANLRARDLAIMSEQADLSRGVMEGLSPEQAAIVSASTEEAARASASAKGVTPEEQRMYQQAAREAEQASGRLGGNAAIASEIMGRENVMAQKRAEADAARQRAFSQAGQFYTTPGLNLLSQTPAAFGAGTGLLSAGMSGSAATSGGFDYNMPLNFAQQLGGAQNQANMAAHTMNIQNKMNSANALGQFGSTLMSAGMNMGGGGFSAPGTMTAENMGAYVGNYGRSAMGLPLKAYTV